MGRDGEEVGANERRRPDLVSPLPKPHLRIVSQGTGRDTHVLFVAEDGKETRLPGVQALTWSLQSADERAVASVVLTGVRADVRAIALELEDSATGETRSPESQLGATGLFEPTEELAGWGNGWDVPPSYGGTDGD